MPETRKPKPHICDFLGLEETLPAFKPRFFPSVKDVLRNLHFHLWTKPRPSISDVALKVADELILNWKPSHVPLMTRTNVKNKVIALYKDFIAIRYAKQDTKAFPGNLERYLETLTPRFDISAKDAINLILADKTLSADEKQEDVSFLKRIRENLPASLRQLDVKRVRRLEKVAERERLASERSLKEEHRKKVG